MAAINFGFRVQTNHFYGTTGSSAGKPNKVTDPDNVTTLFDYTAQGERYRSALDLNGNGTIDLGST